MYYNKDVYKSIQAKQNIKGGEQNSVKRKNDYNMYTHFSGKPKKIKQNSRGETKKHISNDEINTRAISKKYRIIKYTNVLSLRKTQVWRMYTIVYLKGYTMEIESIVAIINSSTSLIAVIFYAILWINKNKKAAKTALQDIIKSIPIYVAEANTQLPNASNAVKLNYVLAEIKEDCEEANIKFKEQKIKTSIKEALENE